MQYTAPEDGLELVAEVAKGNVRRISDPVRLPKTWDWNCKATRSAQLGEFELGPGTHQLTLTLTGKSDVACSRFGSCAFRNLNGQRVAKALSRAFKCPPTVSASTPD